MNTAPRRPRRRVWLVWAGTLLLFLTAGLCALWYLGLWVPNEPSRSQYPVRGVDVSAWQGEIDWEVLAGQGLRFAFLKATEGSSFTDARFAQNWPAALAAGLAAGAYHFFSYDSPGEAQAEHFIATVPTEADALPPVIDLEFYGGYDRRPPDPEPVRRELGCLIERLERHYGRPPILYATCRAYELYLAGHFENCPIWIRQVYAAPRLSDQRAPVFWQYSDRCRLPGYEGAEGRIDLNVFCGSEAEFEAFWHSA